MVQDIIWKADSHSSCQKISCFLYRTRMFITVCTKARHWPLSWSRLIKVEVFWVMTSCSAAVGTTIHGFYFVLFKNIGLYKSLVWARVRIKFFESSYLLIRSRYYPLSWNTEAH